MPHTQTKSTAQWHRKTKDVERLRRIQCSHKVHMCRCKSDKVTYTRLFAEERNHFIVIACDAFSVSADGTQHAIPCFSSLGTHLLVVGLWKTCLHLPRSHRRRFLCFQRICIGLLTVIRRLHTMPHFEPTAEQKNVRIRMSGVSGAANGSAALSLF